MITVLDGSQDDIGSRANFGRGNISQETSAYDQFLMKFANFQMNRHNQEAINSCFILGQVDIEDLLLKCKGLDPNVAE